MRAVFSVLGLLLVVVVISLLAKKQMAPMVATPQGPASAQKIPLQSPQKFKQALDAALQTPRAMPDEKP